MYSVELAKSWVNKNRKELIKSLLEFKEAPDFMKKPGNPFEEVWCCGCWLNEQLKKSGATKEEIHNIGICHGQRSLFGNTYEWAVKYLNEFEENKVIKDKPGIELADEINKEYIKIK